MKELVALVLAGGTGTRFAPFLQDKILFPFLGQPFSDFTVKRALPSAVSRIVVVTNKNNDEYFKMLRTDIPIQTVIQAESKGMADAILTAKDFVSDCRLLILIADDLFDEHLLEQVIAKAEQTNAFGVIPALSVSAYFPGGYLSFSQDRIEKIIEKPQPGTEPSSFINISGHFIQESAVLLSALEHASDGGDDVYERTLTDLMRDHMFVAYPYTGHFTSLKYPWHILSILDDLFLSLKSGKGEGVVIKENVFIEGNVYIGNNVKIFENTKIVGPCYIGDNTIIGNNNVIRHSMIGNNCVTGFNTDITRSYVGDNCWFHSNYIGDSILESNVSMGSGSVLANLRLDEKNIFSTVKSQKMDTHRDKLGAMIARDVRIGVNTSIMPGIKVGSGSFIGAGITVAQDIPSESFVMGKTELIIEKNLKKIGNDRETFKNKL